VKSVDRNVRATEGSYVQVFYLGSVGKVTGHTACSQSSIPGRYTDLSLCQHIRVGSEVFPTISALATGFYLPESRRPKREAEHLSPSSSDV
jgi:hypothetical protein